MATSDADRYRSKYLELLDEVDSKEKEWAQLDQRVRRILNHLLVVAEGPGSPEISVELAEIRDSIREGLDLATLEERIEALHQRILRESQWAEGDDSFPPTHQILIHLVERLPLPEELRDRAVDTVEYLEPGIPPQGLPDAIDRVASLVDGARSLVQQEKRELEALLQEVTGQLSELDQGLLQTQGTTDAGFRSNRDLDAAVSQDVQGLEDSTRGARDLDVLRDQVLHTIASIRGHLDHKRQDDDHRKSALAQEVEQLQGTVRALEQEVSSYQEKTRQARERSLRDPLTECHNRLAYMERAQTEEARWRRYATPLSVAMFDIDHFKSINDQFGHRAGDQVLKAIAKIAAGQLREADFFARYGGEEFVALLPETPLEAATQAAEKVRVAVEAFRFHSRGKRVPLTLSAGITQLREGDQVESALERADQALYRAKQQGRNRCTAAD